ncbi:hypothetical protein ABZ131_20700 [Providencia rettgeri]
MKYKPVLIAAILLALVGCKPSDKDITNSVQEQMNRSLKDPTSSLYRDVVVYRDGDNSAYVCGEVNAKNNYGAYTGFEPFVSKVIINGDKIIPLTGYLDEYTLDFFAPLVCAYQGIKEANDELLRRENEEIELKKAAIELEVKKKAKANKIIDNLGVRSIVDKLVSDGVQIIHSRYNEKSVKPVKIIVSLFHSSITKYTYVITYVIMPNEQDEKMRCSFSFDSEGNLQSSDSLCYSNKDPNLSADFDLSIFDYKNDKYLVVIQEEDY